VTGAAGPCTSASPIPYVRDGEPDLNDEPPQFLQHLGLYAYRRHVLLRLANSPPEPQEQLEKLEQLRALALGYRIHVGVVQHAAIGVDTLEDYDRFVAMYQGRETQEESLLSLTGGIKAA